MRPFPKLLVSEAIPLLPQTLARSVKLLLVTTRLPVPFLHLWQPLVQVHTLSHFIWENRTGNVAQQVRELTAKPDAFSWIPRIHTVERRTDSWKLSSDPYLTL